MFHNRRKEIKRLPKLKFRAYRYQTIKTLTFLRNKSLKICLALAVVLANSSTVYAQDNRLSESQLAHFEEEAKLDYNIAFNLALVYLNGSQGVAKDVPKAVTKLKALAQGYDGNGVKSKAAYILATLYMGQQEHPIDHEQAADYFAIAAKASTNDFLTDAPYHFAMLTKDDLLHIQYLEQGALLGHVPSMVQLAIAYNEQKRVKRNDNAMVKWLRMAADEEHTPAQSMLGSLYFNGEIVYQDYERAFFYLKRAAEHRDADAQAKLGLLYKLGLGTKVDVVKARKWFSLAYESGSALAGENLAGLMLASDNKTEIERGLLIMRELATSGSKSAAQKMVNIYQEGKLVEKNGKELAKWQQYYQEASSEAAQIIGLNDAQQGEKKVYKSSSKAVSLHAKGWEFLKAEKFEQAIPYLEEAAYLKLPAAQLDLAIVLIQEGQKKQQEGYFLSAFAWVKIASDNKQERATELLSDMQESFDVQMLEDALRKYREIKEQMDRALVVNEI